MSEPKGVLSVDLDTVHHHLRGYGIESDRSREEELFQRALERWLEFLQKLGFRATFFVIGETAGIAPELLRSAVREGHEVASHSLHHRQPFASLDDEALLLEVAEPRRLIEEVTGVEVIGFRSPNFETDARVRRVLASCGYRYDASSLTGLCVAARSLVCRMRGGKLSGASNGDWRGESEPHATPEGLMEFPIARTAWLGLPLYATVRFAMGERVFDTVYAWARRSIPFFSFAAHGVDLLGADDGVDPRLNVHPGVKLGHRAKSESLARLLGRMAQDYSMKPYQRHLEEGFSAR